jgi:glycine/D-amino acid oxidase-like deaminating enzyme
MPTRATKRGADRTPIDRDCDVLICGASFAGLSVARELAQSGAKVMVVDRYEIGERQTSACGVPTLWLEALDLMDAHQQSFGELVIHTPHTTARYQLPWTFSTFDYRKLCELLAEQGGDFEFETAKVEGRDGDTVRTDRGDIRAPLIVDALGWRRVLGGGEAIQPPDTRTGSVTTSRSGSTGNTCRLGMGGAFRPARRCASVSVRSTRASMSRTPPCS